MRRAIVLRAEQFGQKHERGLIRHLLGCATSAAIRATPLCRMALAQQLALMPAEDDSKVKATVVRACGASDHASGSR